MGRPVSAAAIVQGATLVEPDKLEQWAAQAQAGDILVYAQGSPNLGRTGAVARSLSDAALVRLHFRRTAGIGEYVAVRTDVSANGLRAAGPKEVRLSGRIDPGDSAVERRLMTAIRRATVQPVLCPSNSELARAAGLRDRAEAKYQIGKLVKAGLIRVETIARCGAEHGGNEPQRVVTVVATGRSTKRPEAR